MNTGFTDSRDSHRWVPGTSPTPRETVEVFSWFADWPLICGCLRLPDSAVSAMVRQEVKGRLAAKLWGMLEGSGETGRGPLFAPMDVSSGELGRPLLVVAGRRAPNISFSYCKRGAWAVVCHPSGSPGIDVAQCREFGAGYPYERVFSSAELSRGREMTRGDPEEAAALLWSAKEAVVKAIGWGFHFVEPRDVRLGTPVRQGTGYEMRAWITGRWKAVFSGVDDAQVPVRTIREKECWVSIAMLKSELTGGRQLRR